jgi:hypothetical protein
MGFIEREIVADISDGKRAVFIPLTYDMTLAPPIPELASAEECAPFTVELKDVSDGHCALELKFGESVSDIAPGSTYAVMVGPDYKIDVFVAFAYRLENSTWDNVDEVPDTVTQVSVGEVISSKTANRRWLAVFRTALAAWRSARTNMHYYFYGNRYLNDILQFATVTGALPENAEVKIEYHDEGEGGRIKSPRIKEVSVTYHGRAERQRHIRAKYAYEKFGVARYGRRDGVSDVRIPCEDEWAIDEVAVEVITEGGETIKTLGRIKYNRAPMRFSLPHAPKYDENKVETSAINQLSRFGDYEVYAVQGYDVEAW